MVGALLVGEITEVFGRDPTGRYWYVRNPDSINGFCWLWGEYATVVGNTALLPVYTPPPTPTPTYTPKPTFTPTFSPAFNPFYSGLDSCVGWWVEVGLENTGTVTFRSMGISVRDLVTDVVVVTFVDGFINNNGCHASNTRDVLVPGKTRIVSSPPFNYNPSGHKLRATVVVCSETGQNGICLTKTIHFTP